MRSLDLDGMFTAAPEGVAYALRLASLLTALGVAWAYDDAASGEDTMVFRSGTATLRVSVPPSPCPACLWRKGAAWRYQRDAGPVHEIPGWRPLLAALCETSP